MKKLLVFGVIVLLSILVAGLYGVVHNQISYTVSPEYFTKFKFEQLHLLNSPLPERVRASIVGFLAAWWMGVPIGLLVGAGGFIHRGHRRMVRISLWSMLVTVGFTLLFGLGGLVYGWFQTRHINLAAYDDWFIPDNVVHLRRFLCAGYMHNSSYLGGTVAILVAWAFHIMIRLRARAAAIPPVLTTPE